MNRTSERLRWQSLAGLFLAVMLMIQVPSFAHAQQDTENPSLDPVAMAKLKAFSDFMGGLKLFTFKAVGSFDESEPSGVNIKRFLTVEAAVQRPDRLVLQFTFDDGTVRKAWYKDAEITFASITDGTYSRMPAPETLDELFVYVERKLGFSPPLADFLVSDIYDAHAKDLLSAVYLGEKVVNDHRLDHISFESQGADWQIWLDAGASPFPRRVQMEFLRAQAPVQYSIHFLEWNRKVVSTDMMFDFVASSDWKEVELPQPKP